MEQVLIVKIGGNVIDSEGNMASFLQQFAQIRGLKLLVHGGGRQATRLSKALGHEVKMVDGRRITDKNTIDVVTMTYGGLINKKIVAALQSHDCNAIGMTGADGNLIKAHKRNHPTIDFGFVGDIDAVNPLVLDQLLGAGFIPVLAALTHDGQGNMLNTNADTITAQTAVALSSSFSVKLVYCFEKRGVLADPDDEGSVISTITDNHYTELRARGVISGGMLPKLDNAFETLQKGVREIIICSAGDLAQAIAGTPHVGTKLVQNDERR